MRRAWAGRLPRGASARLAKRCVIAAVACGSLALAACASGFRPPELIGGTDLVYPSEARAAGVEGRVLVRYDVTADGRVANAAVVSARTERRVRERGLGGGTLVAVPTVRERRQAGRGAEPGERGRLPHRRSGPLRRRAAPRTQGLGQ